MSKQTAHLVSRLIECAAAERASPEELTQLAADVFAACGVSDRDAKVAAEVAVWAQLHGSDSHGAVHLPLYVRGLIDRTINPQPHMQTHRELACTAMMDADRALGLLASREAMDMAIQMAEQHGLGAVAVRNSSHFGVAGYYADRATQKGMIGIALTNAMPAIAPTGATEGLLGTNPIGAAFPVPDGDPIIADFATAAVARSRIRHAVAAGQTSIPEGWALDPEGRPTTDPALALKGSIQPIGGPKGYGLALMVEILCSALSDGQPGFEVTYENMVKRPSGICQFVLAINPQGFAGKVAYDKRVNHVADVIARAKPMPGALPPRLPGGRGHAIAKQAAREGIPLFDNLRAALKSVAEMLAKEGAGV
jgi:LDH2 family malate/lactate/ureidoglycolate dehydrogenase